MHKYRTDMYEGMIAETVMVPGHDSTIINAYFARPLGPGSFPGVVLIHHAPGWDEWYRETTRKFAHHGYLAISPNIYYYFGHGAPEDIAAKVRAAGGVPDDDVVGDIAESLDYLKSLPQSNGRRDYSAPARLGDKRSLWHAEPRDSMRPWTAGAEEWLCPNKS